MVYRDSRCRLEGFEAGSDSLGRKVYIMSE